MNRRNKKPPDQNQRNLITRELDTTLLVEAAAGTGKTTSMIDRMVALLREGRCRIDTLAAVTFTRKAAAELRSRFQVELEKAARSGGPSGARLAEASTRVERCFIGTIHSFCGRMLRERPVEAGVDVAFREIEDAEDQDLRQQAWNEYVERLIAKNSAILDELVDLGLEIGQLAGNFMRLAGYPDVVAWPAPKVPLPDLRPTVKELKKYTRQMEKLVPTFPDDPGYDKLMPLYRLIPRMVRQADLSKPAELMEILDQFQWDVKVIQKNWPEGRDQAKSEQDRWRSFVEEYATSLQNIWLEHRYEAVMRAIRPAMEVYDRLRQASGALNFQDLLMSAASLLRDKPHIRKYFRSRFTHLLVDEFQDTDPIQAEVMLLLTADDNEERDWRKCRPVPGSLFVVGDPKQSIYRFRRADIVTYNQVKKIIEESGGLVVTLSANFRTTGPIVDWTNESFQSVFPDTPSDSQPEYVPLQAARTGGTMKGGTDVQVLRIPQEYGNKDVIAVYEADLIARTIRNAIDGGMTIPRTRNELENGLTEQVTPGDFLIITPYTKQLSIYARSLRELGIPHQVTGGSALNQVNELVLLNTCLRAITRPEDPVALVAVLRSELFGVSDETLYAFKRAGGRFSFYAPVPDDMEKQDAETLADAFTRLRQYALWNAGMPPVAAAEKVLADLGLIVSACAGPGGDIQAGSLGRALEILRAAQAEFWSAKDLVDYLGGLVEQEEKFDGMPARPRGETAVRVMNLHKAKGLESPVVFLADPSGDYQHPVDLHIDRSGKKTRGYMAVYGEARGMASPPLLAKPRRWENWTEKETEFKQAEKMRLFYVAATRAGAQLTISQRQGRGKKNNPWIFFAPGLADRPQLLDPGPQKAPTTKEVTVTAREIKADEKAGRERWTTAARPTYAVAAAKAISVEPARPGPTGREHGTEWGTVIHLLLQTAAESPGADLQALAASALSDQGIAPSLAGTAVDTARSVTDSEIWKRAAASSRRLVEVPFQALQDSDDDTPGAVLRGVIDLAFLEDDGWVIVDYKTDDRPGQNVEKLIERYRPQVHTYAKAWERAVGEPVREKGLFFVGNGQYILC